MKKTKKRFNVVYKLPSGKEWSSRPDLKCSINVMSMLYKLVDNYNLQPLVVKKLEEKIASINEMNFEERILLLDLILKL
tara:strand:+ start:145 stop:381 length:237 start_codon:yes stop_codon:yes gene_type:complete